MGLSVLACNVVQCCLMIIDMCLLLVGKMTCCVCLMCVVVTDHMKGFVGVSGSV